MQTKVTRAASLLGKCKLSLQELLVEGHQGWWMLLVCFLATRFWMSLLTLPYPDKSGICRLSWKQVELTENISWWRQFNVSLRKGSLRLRDPAHQNMSWLMMLFKADPHWWGTTTLGSAWQGCLPHSHFRVIRAPEGFVSPSGRHKYVSRSYQRLCGRSQGNEESCWSRWCSPESDNCSGNIVTFFC